MPSDRASARRSKLKAYYGLSSGGNSPSRGATGSEGAPAKATASANPLDNHGFDAGSYVTGMLKQGRIQDLLSQDAAVSREAEELDGELQMLVYGNYKNFISATHLVSDMRTSVGEMTSKMQQLHQTIDRIVVTHTDVQQRLRPKREEMMKLVTIDTSLKKIDFLVQLPDRLEACFAKRKIGLVVKYWAAGRLMLRRNVHVKSFGNIQGQCVPFIRRTSELLAAELASCFQRGLAEAPTPQQPGSTSAGDAATLTADTIISHLARLHADDVTGLLPLPRLPAPPAAAPSSPLDAAARCDIPLEALLPDVPESVSSHPVFCLKRLCVAAFVAYTLPASQARALQVLRAAAAPPNAQPAVAEQAEAAQRGIRDASAALKSLISDTARCVDILVAADTAYCAAVDRIEKATTTTTPPSPSPTRGDGSTTSAAPPAAPIPEEVRAVHAAFVDNLCSATSAVCAAVFAEMKHLAAGLLSCHTTTPTATTPPPAAGQARATASAALSLGGSIILSRAGVARAASSLGIPLDVLRIRCGTWPPPPPPPPAGGAAASPALPGEFTSAFGVGSAMSLQSVETLPEESRPATCAARLRAFPPDTPLVAALLAQPGAGEAGLTHSAVHLAVCMELHTALSLIPQGVLAELRPASLTGPEGTPGAAALPAEGAPSEEALRLLKVLSAVPDAMLLSEGFSGACVAPGVGSAIKSLYGEARELAFSAVRSCGARVFSAKCIRPYFRELQRRAASEVGVVSPPEGVSPLIVEMADSIDSMQKTLKQGFAFAHEVGAAVSAAAPALAVGFGGAGGGGGGYGDSRSRGSRGSHQSHSDRYSNIFSATNTHGSPDAFVTAPVYNLSPAQPTSPLLLRSLVLHALRSMMECERMLVHSSATLQQTQVDAAYLRRRLSDLPDLAVSEEGGDISCILHDLLEQAVQRAPHDAVLLLEKAQVEEIVHSAIVQM